HARYSSLPVPSHCHAPSHARSIRRVQRAAATPPGKTRQACWQPVHKQCNHGATAVQDRCVADQSSGLTSSPRELVKRKESTPPSFNLSTSSFASRALAKGPASRRLVCPQAATWGSASFSNPSAWRRMRRQSKAKAAVSRPVATWTQCLLGCSGG